MVRAYPYLHLDVFTERPFAGNQLAVYLDAEGLDAREMQAIALEMNFSETTFALPAETSDTDVRVRIFTPRAELPMAGHPTIGTTFALAHARRIDPSRSAITLGLGVGPTKVALEWEGDRLRFAWMTQASPSFEETPADMTALALALGVDERSIRDTGLPPQVVSSGTPFLFVPLLSRRDVNVAAANPAALSAFFKAAGVPERPVFLFTLEAGEYDAADVYSRMFAPTFGIAEDPATGGACGPLGGYLLHHGAMSMARAGRIVNLQGEKMGRPSWIHIAVNADGDRIRDVRVGGASVIVGTGTISL